MIIVLILFSPDYADEKRNYRHYEKQVNEDPGDLKNEKPGDPGYEQNNAYD
jgi:hypothetical protein